MHFQETWAKRKPRPCSAQIFLGILKRFGQARIVDHIIRSKGSCGAFDLGHVECQNPVGYCKIEIAPCCTLRSAMGEAVTLFPIAPVQRTPEACAEPFREAASTGATRPLLPFCNALPNSFIIKAASAGAARGVSPPGVAPRRWLRSRRGSGYQSTRHSGSSLRSDPQQAIPGDRRLLH